MSDGDNEQIKRPNHGGLNSKKYVSNIFSEKCTFSGNFTQTHRFFDVITHKEHMRRAGMRKDILDAVMRRTEEKMLEGERKTGDDNQLYEDPRDVIGEKPPKPPRKRNIQGIAVISHKKTEDSKSLLKEQKRKLSKKYESLIMNLMDRCEENVVLISEKDSHILKLKEKLKTVLEYNKLFAEENDQLKTQYATMAKYIEECKIVIKEVNERNVELEKRSKELEEKVKQYEVPDRDQCEPSTAIPLVEVCMSCSSRQLVLNQTRDQNSRLQKDMQALKDVLYRLNVQLSRYQEKVRINIQTVAAEVKSDIVYKPGEKIDFDSLLTASLGYKGDMSHTEDTNPAKADDQPHSSRVVDLSGLLSAQAIAPLFDAYQENLQEKESLILDYEKQFENMNKKSKQIVGENKSLAQKVASLEEQLGQVRQSYKKIIVERETVDIERATLLERAERAESKLKEVYELYEDKMAAMMRDYETVHREYFNLKNALEASEGKMAQMDAFRARTVPADLHERRLDHCKRLLEELKHQYNMENERKTEQLNKSQEQLRVLQEKYEKISSEYETAREELTQALKNVKLYRKAAVVFRQRLKASTARMNRVRRSARKVRAANEPLQMALQTLDRIKAEIKLVKSRAHSSLEELERRVVEQERRAEQARGERRRELERAHAALKHKEAIIRSLIDKVADIEEVRLSQTNAHRLQGIVSESSPDRSSASPNLERRESNTVKLTPRPGGYYQEQEGRRKTKG